MGQVERLVLEKWIKSGQTSRSWQQSDTFGLKLINELAEICAVNHSRMLNLPQITARC